MSETSIVIAFEESFDSQSIDADKLMRITRLANDVTFKRMKRYGVVWYVVYVVWCCMVYGVWVWLWYGVRYSMVWYGMLCYSMLWYGVVWYFMVWHGMLYGMVYGMV